MLLVEGLEHGDAAGAAGRMAVLLQVEPCRVLGSMVAVLGWRPGSAQGAADVGAGGSPAPDEAVGGGDREAAAGGAPGFVRLTSRGYFADQCK